MFIIIDGCFLLHITDLFVKLIDVLGFSIPYFSDSVEWFEWVQVFCKIFLKITDESGLQSFVLDVNKLIKCAKDLVYFVNICLDGVTHLARAGKIERGGFEITTLNDWVKWNILCLQLNQPETFLSQIITLGSQRVGKLNLEGSTSFFENILKVISLEYVICFISCVEFILANVILYHISSNDLGFFKVSVAKFLNLHTGKVKHLLAVNLLSLVN